MDTIYNILTGPGLIVSLAVFFIGLLMRFVLYFVGLDWKLERVAYKADFAHGLKGGLHSAFKWLIPYATRSWRVNPFFTLCFFMLHAGAILVPLFLIGHNVILQEKFGVSLFTIPQELADILSILTLIAIFFMVIRRIALTEVRILTTWYDYFILFIAGMPFLTGLLAAAHLGNYQLWLTSHVFFGELLLILTPFTKMSHVVLYFASRIQIGMDFAIKRGGHSRKSGPYFPW